jgi:Meiotically up-regulated gene 113
VKPKDSSDTNYIYRGQPIKPQIIIHLTKELFAGKLVERQTIIDEVLSAHLKRGGLRSSAPNFPLSVTKALTRMKEAGEAENPSYGFWKILPKDTEVTSEDAEASDSTILPNAESKAASPPEDSGAEVTLGTGPGSVYVYYLPTYRMRAEERSEHTWQCKIGQTEGSALDRVLSQAATALPEKPFLAVVIRTKYPRALETAFHAVLTLRGLRIEDAPGSEWFLTSPSEVIALAKLFDPRSYEIGETEGL